MIKFIKNLFKPRQKHIWKVTKEENLGSYIYYGNHIEDMCTMYRIAVYEECILTGEKRVYERNSVLPVEEN